jgi:hypothetical protein
MATYKTLASLKGKTLKFGDTVIIHGLTYNVHSDFLSNDRGQNEQIFKILSLNKVKFCEKYYKYATRSGGSWPESKDRDYKALTRVAIALMKCKNVGTPEQIFIGDMGGYNTTIYKGYVEIGCRTFQKEEVTKFVNAWDKLNKKRVVKKKAKKK